MVVPLCKSLVICHSLNRYANQTSYRPIGDSAQRDAWATGIHPAIDDSIRYLLLILDRLWRNSH